MGRNQKLYLRLDELEEELRVLLLEEFRRVAGGGWSSFLWWSRSPVRWGKRWRQGVWQQIEKIEKEIERLRSKLEEDHQGPVLTLLNSYIKECEGAKDDLKGGAAHIAKKYIDELEKQSKV